MQVSKLVYAGGMGRQAGSDIKQQRAGDGGVVPQGLTLAAQRGPYARLALAQHAADRAWLFKRMEARHLTDA